MKKESVTLFQFWGNGDTLNYTWAPRLIKQKYPDIKVNIIAKEGHEIYFKTNPFVDNIKIITKKEAHENNHCLNTKFCDDQINVWCGSDKTKEQLSKFYSWNVCWEIGKIINKFFDDDVIKENDNLLPELFYTDEERNKINEFVKKYTPFIIIETEHCSLQHPLGGYKIMQTISNYLTNKKINYFTSFINCTVIPQQFCSLNNYSVRDVGLMIEKADAFYGLSSGLSVVGMERTLNEPKRRIITHPTYSWYNSLLKNRKLENTKFIPITNYVPFVINDIKKIKE